MKYEGDYKSTTKKIHVIDLKNASHRPNNYKPST